VKLGGVAVREVRVATENVILDHPRVYDREGVGVDRRGFLRR